MLVAVVGMVGASLGACGSSTGEEQAGSACITAVTAHEADAKAICTKAADLGNADGMAGLGLLANEAGDAAAAKKTLGTIVAKYPLSNAADLAKKRLASTK